MQILLGFTISQVRISIVKNPDKNCRLNSGKKVSRENPDTIQNIKTMFDAKRPVTKKFWKTINRQIIF